MSQTKIPFFDYESEQQDADSREKRILDAYRDLFDTDDGRLVLSHVLAFCDIFRTGLEAGLDLQFLDGKREVGLMILRNSGKLVQMRENMGV